MVGVELVEGVRIQLIAPIHEERGKGLRLLWGSLFRKLELVFLAVVRLLNRLLQQALDARLVYHLLQVKGRLQGPTQLQG